MDAGHQQLQDVVDGIRKKAASDGTKIQDVKGAVHGIND